MVWILRHTFPLLLTVHAIYSTLVSKYIICSISIWLCSTVLVYFGPIRNSVSTKIPLAGFFLKTFNWMSSHSLWKLRKLSKEKTKTSPKVSCRCKLIFAQICTHELELHGTCQYLNGNCSLFDLRSLCWWHSDNAECHLTSVHCTDYIRYLRSCVCLFGNPRIVASDLDAAAATGLFTHGAH